MMTECCRNQLRAQLAQLPAAQNKVEIVVPGLPEENEEIEVKIEVDAADEDKRRKHEEEERIARELRKRSQVLIP